MDRNTQTAQSAPTITSLLDKLDNLSGFAADVARRQRVFADVLGGGVPTSPKEGQAGVGSPAILHTLQRRVDELEISLHEIRDHQRRAAENMGVAGALEEAVAPPTAAASIGARR